MHGMRSTHSIVQRSLPVQRIGSKPWIFVTV